MKIKFLSSIYLIMSALLLGACASNAKTYHFITLETTTSARAPLDKNAPIYALRHFSLPQYLSENNILYLKDNGKMISDNDNKWAQNLSEIMRRSLQNNIGSILQNDNIYLYPLASNIRAERFIDIEINELIADFSSGELLFDTRFQISAARQIHPQTYHLRKKIPLVENNIDSIITAHRKALKILSATIAANLQSDK